MPWYEQEATAGYSEFLQVPTSVVRRNRTRVCGVRMPATMPQMAAQRNARSVDGPSGRAAAARCSASDMRFIA